MSLKDLITDASKVDEASIERVVATFVRYDPKSGRIIFTPDGVALSHENKILVYLSAVAGWSFVSDAPPDLPTKPADLESVLGIAGGSLRPALKKLKDLHLLANEDGHYSIQAANLPHIEGYVNGVSKPTKRKSRASRATSPTNAEASKEAGKRRKSKGQKGGGSASSAFDDLVKLGFFDQPKTLKQLQKKLEQRGLIFPQTALSGRVLEAVRKNLLDREKVEADGRKVWTYVNHG